MMSAMADKQVLRERADVFGNPIQCVNWFDRHLAGFTHSNKRGLDRLPLIKKLTKGSKIVLVPEPENPYDRNAILLYSTDDLENDVGYLDSVGANQICGLMERGATFSAEVFYVFYEKPDVPFVRIMIYQLTPALQDHRPIRKGAPVYKATLQPSVRNNEPPIEQHKGEPAPAHQISQPANIELTQLESEGFWSGLKRFLGH
jgi:hypothetical protein